MRYSTSEPTPLDVADALAPYVKGKVVYDLGAGDGQFALALTPYAKEVVAVEIEPAHAASCRERGLKTIEADFNDVDIGSADVIYCFLGFLGNCALTDKIREDGWSGTVISHYYPLHTNPTDIWRPQHVVHVGRTPFLIYRL